MTCPVCGAPTEETWTYDYWDWEVYFNVCTDETCGWNDLDDEDDDWAYDD